MDEKFDRDVYISAFAVNVYVVHGTKIYIYSAFMEMIRTSLYYIPNRDILSKLE